MSWQGHDILGLCCICFVGSSSANISGLLLDVLQSHACLFFCSVLGTASLDIFFMRDECSQMLLHTDKPRSL